MTAGPFGDGPVLGTGGGARTSKTRQSRGEPGRRDVDAGDRVREADWGSRALVESLILAQDQRWRRA